ncbi:phospholipase A and acyltransferase 2 [Pholidichthys leucotaenia]
MEAQEENSPERNEMQPQLPQLPAPCLGLWFSTSKLPDCPIRGRQKPPKKVSHPKLFPGDIVEYPRNKYFSHFAVFYGEKDGVPYVAHLTCRDSDSKLPLFGRALRSEVKLEPLELLGSEYKVSNMLDDVYTARDFHGVVKPAIDDMLGREVTFDILFHNSEHQATLFRYGVKNSEQIETIYEYIMPAWKKLFKEKKL